MEMNLFFVCFKCCNLVNEGFSPPGMFPRPPNTPLVTRDAGFIFVFCQVFSFLLRSLLTEVDGKFLSGKPKVRFFSLATRGWWRWDGGTAGGDGTLITAKKKNETPPGLRFNILTDGI